MKSPTKTLGVFLPIMDQYYQTDLWQGILKSAHDLGHNVLFFCGSVLNAPLRNDINSNVVYNLVNTHKLDGIIITSGTLANYSTTSFFNSFVNKYKSIPLMHLFYHNDELNSINIDNYKSMKRLATHIIEDHDFTNYAFISGPASNSESKQRLKAFKDTLNEHQIPHENFKLYEGNFLKGSSELIVHDIYENDDFKPDIIVCANDEMAIGTLSVLNKLKITTPSSVAFTGFDDIPDAITFTPNFTTISQPFYKMGYESVKGLDSLINNTVDHINTLLTGDLKIRESCGCNQYQNHEFVEPFIHNSHRSYTDGEALKVIRLTKLSEFLENCLPTSEAQYLNKISTLINTLINELNKQTPKNSFINEFTKLYQISHSQLISFNWIEFIQWLKAELYDLGHAPSEELHNIFYHTNYYVNILSLRKIRKESYDFMDMYYYSSELIVELTQADSSDDIFRIIVPYLKAYDIRDYYVCLFDEAIEVEDVHSFIYPPVITMSFGYQDSSVLDSFRFNSSSMLPPHLVDSNGNSDYIFYPMFFGSTHYGYHICKPETALKTIFRTIKDQIASSLYRISVQDQLDNYTKQLKHISNHDPLTKVLNRRGIYEKLETLISTDTEDLRVGIVYGDIDGLKEINDKYGHYEGDFAIKHIAKLLTESVTDGFTGRYGGDEFLCVLKNISQDNYDKAFTTQFNKLIDQFNKQTTKPYRLSISFGFSVVNLNNLTNIDDIFEEADRNLYIVKNAKKNKPQH